MSHDESPWDRQKYRSGRWAGVKAKSTKAEPRAELSQDSRSVSQVPRSAYGLMTPFCLFSRCLVLLGPGDTAGHELNSNSYLQGASSRD